MLAREFLALPGKDRYCFEQKAPGIGYAVISVKVDSAGVEV